MVKENKPRPFLKWAGGKTQMLETLKRYKPMKYNKYIEPFIGGGALFFEMMPENAIISDSNPELINLYQIVANDVEGLIKKLKVMENTEEFYYKTRAIDPENLTNLEKAARMLYLNKTCFNGLYRVNKNGQFNVPYGKYKNPKICDEENLRLASKALKNVEIVHADYKKILDKYAEKEDFIFLDPPYFPISKFSDFKRYTKEQFSEQDQIQLAEDFIRLSDLGCKVLLTNSNHPMVHKLYRDFDISVYQTKRYINSDPTKRNGQDVVVSSYSTYGGDIEDFDNISIQINKFPSTRYMGSKEKLLQHILSKTMRFDFNTVLDLFSGSGVVSYMFKSANKEVYSNDYMSFSSNITKSLVENNNIILREDEINYITTEHSNIDNFVSETFKGLYFDDNDNKFIDIIRTNLKFITDETKKSLILTCLVRACLKKRPRGIFTYTGERYNDGRRDLNLTLKEHFLAAVELVNSAVFDNGRANKSFCMDAINFQKSADLVYIDPPYYSPLSDNEYVRRYHFVEGLVRDWEGVEMQWHTKTKKFKSYPSPFKSEQGAYSAFDTIFDNHKDSILVVSYSSNSLPTKEDMVNLMLKYKRNVEVSSVDYKYSFGNKIKKAKNNVKEYLFIGY